MTKILFEITLKIIVLSCLVNTNCYNFKVKLSKIKNLLYF